MPEQWKELITVGNQRFSEKDYLKAQELYKSAVEAVQGSLKHFQPDGDTVACYLVSCQNLADCLQRQRKNQEAQDQLRECYFKLAHAYDRNPSCQDLESAVNRSYQELSLHIKTNGCLIAKSSKSFVDYHETCGSPCNAVLH